MEDNQDTTMMEEESPSSTHNKRRRTTAQTSSFQDATAASAVPDYMALHHSLDPSGMPFYWVQRDSGSRKAITTDDLQACRQGIQSLSRQLLQVKRRLQPAAERCAAAVSETQQQAKCEEDIMGSCSPMMATTSTPSHEFQQARSICNPFEILGQGHHRKFMNRSAIKLANIDALLDFRLVQPMPAFCFVDLCGAPGGFSEYIQHVCCENPTIRSCHGYGLSLLGPNEHGTGLQWRLSDKLSNKRGTTCHYTVCTGRDGTGDIYKWDNVASLHEKMQNDGNTQGAHLVVADGGFDAQRDCEDQEAISQKLIICQVAAALLCLRPGGTLVLKLFGSQTNGIRCLMGKLYEAFSKLFMTKPISSRPASAERYLVATGFLGMPTNWNPLEWRDSVFLAWGFDRNNGNRDLATFLDLFDHDMLHLNLTACFSILSYLETKQRGLESNQALLSYGDPYEVPVARYRRAWRLA